LLMFAPIGKVSSSEPQHLPYIFERYPLMSRQKSASRI
jgi:hypothetical protein